MRVRSERNYPYLSPAYASKTSLAISRHIFCRGCLNEALCLTGPRCPACREPVEASAVVPDRFAAAIVANLRCPCHFRHAGCPWIGSRAALHGHLATECGRLLVRCEACDAEVPRARLDGCAHLPPCFGRLPLCRRPLSPPRPRPQTRADHAGFSDPSRPISGTARHAPRQRSYAHGGAGRAALRWRCARPCELRASPSSASDRTRTLTCKNVYPWAYVGAMNMLLPMPLPSSRSRPSATPNAIRVGASYRVPSRAPQASRRALRAAARERAPDPRQHAAAGGCGGNTPKQEAAASAGPRRVPGVSARMRVRMLACSGIVAWCTWCTWCIVQWMSAGKEPPTKLNVAGTVLMPHCQA